MRIRLTGSAAECDAAAELISTVIEVLDEYSAYQHRAGSCTVRVYLDARVLAESTTRKEIQP